MKTRSAAKTIDDVAKALGCNKKAAASRLVALGYVRTCGRCGGSGHYSFNQINGTRCYGCDGRGRCIVRITDEIVAAAKARQDAGDLAAYFAKNAARAAAKKAIAPLVAEARAIYEVISNAYTRANDHASAVCRDSLKTSDVCYYSNEEIGRAQGMNNSLYWGDADKVLFGTDAVRHIEYRVQKGREDAEVAVAKIRERITDLTTLRDAALPHLEMWVETPMSRARA